MSLTHNNNTIIIAQKVVAVLVVAQLVNELNPFLLETRNLYSFTNRCWLVAIQNQIPLQGEPFSGVEFSFQSLLESIVALLWLRYGGGEEGEA